MNCINADELKSNLERVIKHGVATNGDHAITAEFLLKWVEENSFSVDADKGTSIESTIKWVDVNEKLPEDDIETSDRKSVKVLTCRAGVKNSVSIRVREKYYDTNKWTWSRVCMEPTHWAYLPEPAKE